MKENLLKIVDFINKKRDLLEDTDQDDCSLFNGMCGMAIYYYYVGTYLEDPSLIKRGEDLITKIQAKLESGEINFRIFHSFSYGLAGVGYTFWHLNKFRLMPNEEEQSFHGIEQMLVDCCRNDFYMNISDNLHGPMGVVYYLSKVASQPAVKEAVDNIITMYYDMAIKDDKGLRIKNMIVKEVHDKEYNMSLSHGLSGNLSILADAHCNGLSTPQTMEIIDEGLRYIHNTERDKTEPGKTNSFFPSFLSEHEGFSIPANIHNYSTRLAWCYGDLNMSFLFFRLAKMFNRDDYYQKALSIARNTLSRKTRIEAQVTDIYFCHGSSGLAYLYLKLYDLTGEQEFLEQSEHWFKLTDERLDGSLNDLTTESPMSLLEGYPGVALTYLSRMMGRSLPWDDIFFLNI